MWDEERSGPDEAFELTSDVIAVDGDTAVARVEVGYGEPDHEEFLDMWIMRFAEDGRCRSFEEWWATPKTTTRTDPTDAVRCQRVRRSGCRACR